MPSRTMYFLGGLYKGIILRCSIILFWQVLHFTNFLSESSFLGEGSRPVYLRIMLMFPLSFVTDFSKIRTFEIKILGLSAEIIIPENYNP
jgi:hypothetical protein